MHGVCKPHDCRHALHRRVDLSRACTSWVGDPLRVTLDLGQARHVRFARDRDDEHLAAFERMRNRIHLHALRGGRDAFDVAHHQALRREPVPVVVAENRSRRRHACVVGARGRATGLGVGMLCLRDWRRHKRQHSQRGSGKPGDGASAATNGAKQA